MDISSDLPDSSVLRRTRPSGDKVDFTSLTVNTLSTNLIIAFHDNPPRDNVHSIWCDSRLYRFIH